MAQQIVEVPFGAWRPDAPDYNNPGCITANNVFPTAGGYSPFPGTSAQGDTISEAVRGARQLYRSGGTSLIVGGSNTKLFIHVSGTLTETSVLSSITDGNSWDFAQFNKYVFAAAPNNNIKYLSDIDSDTTWSDAPGSPPQAKHLARVGNYLMAANLSGLSLPFSLQISAENDPTDWPTPGTNDARLKASGRVALQQEYGPITGLAGDRYPMVFQERGISRLEPVGPPLVFRITPIEEARGCIAPRSLVTVGFLTYFLAHDGFWATDGNSVQPIATMRINEWFAANVSEGDRFRTHGAVSWRNQSIIWTFYPADDATGYKKQIIYSWAEDRWSTASLEVDWLVSDRVTNPINSTDSYITSAFVQNDSAQSELAYLLGPNLEATIETSDFEPRKGFRVAVNAIYPLLEASQLDAGSLALEDADLLLMENGDTLELHIGAITAALTTTGAAGEGQSSSSATPLNKAGFCPVRGDGRFARAKIVLPQATIWDKAQGCQIEYRVSGRR